MQNILDKVDQKNISVAKQVLNLRNHIDVHRIIALNVEAISQSKAPNTFFGHIQYSSLEQIAIGFSRLFEYSNRNELDSLPAILRILPEKNDPRTIQAVRKFGEKYGNFNRVELTNSHVRGTYALFIEIHSMTIERLREYRDKKGAHRESNKTIESLPSHDDFEALLEFIEEFYKIVSDYFLDIGPALIGRKVGFGLKKILEQLGVDEPKYDFEK